MRIPWFSFFTLFIEWIRLIIYMFNIGDLQCSINNLVYIFSIRLLFYILKEKNTHFIRKLFHPPLSLLAFSGISVLRFISTLLRMHFFPSELSEYSNCFENDVFTLVQFTEKVYVVCEHLITAWVHVHRHVNTQIYFSCAQTLKVNKSTPLGPRKYTKTHNHSGTLPILTFNQNHLFCFLQ